LNKSLALPSALFECVAHCFVAPSDPLWRMFGHACATLHLLLSWVESFMRPLEPFFGDLQVNGDCWPLKAILLLQAVHKPGMLLSGLSYGIPALRWWRPWGE
jgi:hypothetical protein